MHAKPQKEHEWLHQLAGEWTYEMEASMKPGEPSERMTGDVRVRVLRGGLWVVGEMDMFDPEGTSDTSMIALSFDPARGRYVGTFVAPSMPHLWVYDGALDADGRALTLESEGPSFSGDGTMARYRDRIELEADGGWTLRSLAPTAEGGWQEFMAMRHRRAEQGATAGAPSA